MLFKATPENQTTLLSLPESGMGYQLISARFPAEFKVKKLIVLNSEIIIEHDESELLFFNKLVREGWHETKTNAEEQLLQDIELKSKEEYFDIVAEEDSSGKKGARENRVQPANGWMAYVRLSPYYDDKRIDRVNKCLRPGSYATTIDDYLTCTINKYDPIDRYALPNDDPIKWVFNIVPTTSDTFQQGIVQPDFGKNGGGVECYFEKGTSFGTFTSEAHFPYRMQTNTIILPEKFVSYLINLPESGMGYQLVKIFLKNGEVLHNLKVVNSCMLLLDEKEIINPSQISKLELEE